MLHIRTGSRLSYRPDEYESDLSSTQGPGVWGLQASNEMGSFGEKINKYKKVFLQNKIIDLLHYSLHGNININIPCFGFSSIDYIFQRWYAEIKSSVKYIKKSIDIHRSIFTSVKNRSNKKCTCTCELFGTIFLDCSYT